MARFSKTNKQGLLQLNLKRNLFIRVFRPKALPLLAFFIPLIIRTIPEMIMGPYLVGFDTLGYYVPNTLLWLQKGVGFWDLMAIAPFLYLLLMGTTYVGVPIVISLKVISPLLLGLLGFAVFSYANKTLSWSPKRSLLVAFFATIYFVALRVSWDMLRSELGLIFLFATLFFLKKEGSPSRNGLLLLLAMLSVVLAHQLVAVIMFFIVLARIAQLYIHKEIGEFRRIIVCSAPAAFLFFLIVYANFIVSPHFSVISGFPRQDLGGFKALFGFASYSDLVIDTLGFLFFCFLPMIPLLVLGVKKFKGNLQLKGWIFWIFISLLLVLISPNAFFAVYPYRWTLLLTYPLAFYATAGFAHLKSFVYKAFFSVLLVTLSLGFIFLPNNLAFPYFVSYSNYFPSSMLQNTVALSDAQDTANAIQWTKNNMSANSHLLVHDAFYGWALLSLDSERLLPYGYVNPETVAERISENGSMYTLYLIWWINGSGWHGRPSVSSCFRQVYQSGEIAIFIYNSSYPLLSNLGKIMVKD